MSDAAIVGAGVVVAALVGVVAYFMFNNSNSQNNNNQNSTSGSNLQTPQSQATQNFTAVAYLNGDYSSQSGSYAEPFLAYNGFKNAGYYAWPGYNIEIAQPINDAQTFSAVDKFISSHYTYNPQSANSQNPGTLMLAMLGGN